MERIKTLSITQFQFSLKDNKVALGLPLASDCYFYTDDELGKSVFEFFKSMHKQSGFERRELYGDKKIKIVGKEDNDNIAVFIDPRFNYMPAIVIAYQDDGIMNANINEIGRMLADKYEKIQKNCKKEGIRPDPQAVEEFNRKSEEIAKNREVPNVLTLDELRLKRMNKHLH